MVYICKLINDIQETTKEPLSGSFVTLITNIKIKQVNLLFPKP